MRLAARHIRILGVGALALLASACVEATPDFVLRDETVAPTQGSLCTRMAHDFDMVLVEGTDIRGHLYRVSHADRMISARGVSWGFRLVDENPEETCVTEPNGVTCDIAGPAEFRVQSNAGRATYKVLSGDRARVASEGAIMTCRELREES